MDIYAVILAGLGPLMLPVVAFAVNNVPRWQKYPEYWFQGNSLKSFV